MTSRLAEMQARFQQKQIQEREEKLLRLYENQQQRAFERVGHGSAGSVGSTGAGKVRQIFEEKRQKAGVDKSYPLEPLSTNKIPTNGQTKPKNATSRITTTRTVKSTTVQKINQIKNNSSKPNVTVNKKREIVQSIQSINNNNNISNSEKIFVNESHRELDRSSRNFIDLMNNCNLTDNLDDEELPEIGFDEPDFKITNGKLPSVAKKVPTNDNTSRNKHLENKASLKASPSFKNEIKPIIKKTIRTISSTPNTSKPASSNIPPKSASNLDIMQAPARKSSPPQSARSKVAPKGSAKSVVAKDDLYQCKFCGRRFAQDRLQVHEGICAKTLQKKRKAYDATKHRVQGTELEPYVKKGNKGSQRSIKSLSKKDWRKTHEEFISAIRAAKMAQAHIARGGKISDLPPPPPSSNPDYVQCPHCGRKFNQAAAERHIPKCATYDFNKPKPGARGK